MNIRQAFYKMHSASCIIQLSFSQAFFRSTIHYAIYIMHFSMKHFTSIHTVHTMHTMHFASCIFQLYFSQAFIQCSQCILHYALYSMYYSMKHFTSVTVSEKYTMHFSMKYFTSDTVIELYLNDYTIHYYFIKLYSIAEYSRIQ